MENLKRLHRNESGSNKNWNVDFYGVSMSSLAIEGFPTRKGRIDYLVRLAIHIVRAEYCVSSRARSTHACEFRINYRK